MSRKKQIGICRICGKYGRLTYEHFPPRAAFNSERIRVKCGEALMTALRGTNTFDEVKEAVFQRGLGDYTLCADCNNKTGRWYCPAFIEWSLQAAKIIGVDGGYCQLRTYPLQVIKQIIAMIFSAADGELGKNTDYLVKFLLNKEQKYLPAGIRVYGYLTTDAGRSTGRQVVADCKTQEVQEVIEFAFPPMGYLFTTAKESPDQRLADISYFARYHYDDCCDICQRLPVLPIYTPFAADFRPREQVLREAAENR